MASLKMHFYKVSLLGVFRKTACVDYFILLQSLLVCRAETATDDELKTATHARTHINTDKT